MGVGSLTAANWTVSTRQDGEVLAVWAGDDSLQLGVFATGGGFSEGELAGWLKDLVTVAREGARQDVNARDIPALLHHALTGLLFSHAELWERAGGMYFSAALIYSDGLVGIGWVGEADLQVHVDGIPQDIDWAVVRDSEGRDARAATFDASQRIRLWLSWNPGMEEDNGVAVDAQWVPDASAAPDTMEAVTERALKELTAEDLAPVSEEIDSEVEDHTDATIGESTSELVSEREPEFEPEQEPEAQDEGFDEQPGIASELIRERAFAPPSARPSSSIAQAFDLDRYGVSAFEDAREVAPETSAGAESEPGDWSAESFEPPSEDTLEAPATSEVASLDSEAQATRLEAPEAIEAAEAIEAPGAIEAAEAIEGQEAVEALEGTEAPDALEAPSAGPTGASAEFSGEFAAGESIEARKPRRAGLWATIAGFWQRMPGRSRQDERRAREEAAAEKERRRLEIAAQRRGRRIADGFAEAPAEPSSAPASQASTEHAIEPTVVPAIETAAAIAAEHSIEPFAEIETEPFTETEPSPETETEPFAETESSSESSVEPEPEPLAEEEVERLSEPEVATVAEPVIVPEPDSASSGAGGSAEAAGPKAEQRPAQLMLTPLSKRALQNPERNAETPAPLAEERMAPIMRSTPSRPSLRAAASAASEARPAPAVHEAKPDRRAPSIPSGLRELSPDPDLPQSAAPEPDLPRLIAAPEVEDSAPAEESQTAAKPQTLLDPEALAPMGRGPARLPEPSEKRGPAKLPELAEKRRPIKRREPAKPRDPAKPREAIESQQVIKPGETIEPRGTIEPRESAASSEWAEPAPAKSTAEAPMAPPTAALEQEPADASAAPAPVAERRMGRPRRTVSSGERATDMLSRVPIRAQWPTEEEMASPLTRWARWIVGVLLVAGLFAIGWQLGGIEPDRETGAGKTNLWGQLLQGFSFATGRYHVSVGSEPDGASIAVDGRDLGRRTPAVVDLKPGAHQVTLSFADLGSATFGVRGLRDQSVTLHEALWGRLSVEQDNPEVPVSVSVDGRDLGFVPVTMDSVEPGAHDVRFSGPGMTPWAQTVAVKVRESARIVAHPMISPATGVLSIRATLNDSEGSSPLAGGEVWLDHELVGRTPLTLELPRGPHSVKVVYGQETAPVQVIDLPGGNQRFASFQLGTGGPDIRLALVSAVSRVDPDQPALVSAGLDGVGLSDVREMWLHVRGPDDNWRRYQLNVMKTATGVAGVSAFPPGVFDDNGLTKYYLSALLITGDEYFTEIFSAQLVTTPRAPAAK